MLPELITLTIVIGFFYGLHQLTTAITSRRKTESSLLKNLEFDPARHKLAVTLRDGQTVTGTPDPRNISSLQAGLLLTDAQHNGRENLPRSTTFIPGHNITAIGTIDRNKKQNE